MARSLRLPALLLLSLIFLAEDLRGEDDELSLDRLFNLKVEVSSSTPDTIFNTPSSVSVIDRYTIKKYNFRTISEAIETLAGVSVNRSYFAQNLPSIRGILQENHINRLLILIDGVPTWMSVTGGAELERINVNDLERIEVLKGPASVLYGTNAYSGAINLVLRKTETEWEEEFIGELRIANGFQSGLQSTNGHIFYSDDNFQYFIAGSGQNQRGYKYPGTNKSGESGFFKDEEGVYIFHKDYQKLSNITGKLAYRTSFGTHSLIANSYDNEMSYLGARPTINQGIGNPYLSSGSLINYNFHMPISSSAISASFTHDANSIEFSRKDDNRVKGRIEGNRISSRLQANIYLAQSLNLEAGADFEQRTSKKFEIFDPHDQKVFQNNEMSNRSNMENSIFLQLGFNGEKLDNSVPIRLLIGARRTNNEAFDSNTSLRSTLVYNISSISSLKLVYGESFRAPTLFELFYKDSAATNEIFGNADLLPEKSNSMEIAYLVSPLSSLFLQALVFKGKYEDKIVRVRRHPQNPNDQSLTFQNGKTFSVSGAELEVKYLNPQIANIMLSYAIVRGEQDDQAVDAVSYKYVPEQSATLAINRSFDNVSTSLVMNYMDEREGALAKIKADVLVDAGVSYHMDFGSHSIQVKNITNRQREFPEYIRGNLNSLRSGQGQEIIYEFSTVF